MDNSELVDAANGLVQWANSQELRPADLEKVMSKVQAKIITDRLGLKLGSPSPSDEQWKQELLRNQETLMHDIVSRIFKICGRK